MAEPVLLDGQDGSVAPPGQPVGGGGADTADTQHDVVVGPAHRASFRRWDLPPLCQSAARGSSGRVSRIAERLCGICRKAGAATTALTAATVAVSAVVARARTGQLAVSPARTAPAAAPPFIAELSQACVSVPAERGAALAAMLNRVARVGPRHSPATGAATASSGASR